MYCTARAKIAPLAFSPFPLGTMRPSSLIPSLMFPRRRRSTSFCDRSELQAEREYLKRETYVIVLSLSCPFVGSHCRASRASPSSRSGCRAGTWRGRLAVLASHSLVLCPTVLVLRHGMRMLRLLRRNLAWNERGWRGLHCNSAQLAKVGGTAGMG